MVMYTYAGDANLTGKITGDDYFQIDQGFASHGSLTGYFNGDFNYDGKINADDYFLIDRNYSAQDAHQLLQRARGTETANTPGLAGPGTRVTSRLLRGSTPQWLRARRRRQRLFTSPGTPGEAG